MVQMQGGVFGAGEASPLGHPLPLRTRPARPACVHSLPPLPPCLLRLLSLRLAAAAACSAVATSEAFVAAIQKTYSPSKHVPLLANGAGAARLPPAAAAPGAPSHAAFAPPACRQQLSPIMRTPQQLTPRPRCPLCVDSRAGGGGGGAALPLPLPPSARRPCHD